VKVGDTVKCRINVRGSLYKKRYRVGMIVGFDKDNDPVVCYYDVNPVRSAMYRRDVEVLRSGGDSVLKPCHKTQ